MAGGHYRFTMNVTEWRGNDHLRWCIAELREAVRWGERGIYLANRAAMSAGAKNGLLGFAVLIPAYRTYGQQPELRPIRPVGDNERRRVDYEMVDSISGGICGCDGCHSW